MRILPEPNTDHTASAAVSDQEITDAALRILYRGNPIVDKAEEAVLAFGNVDRATAQFLLHSWKHRVALSPREMDATLARFPRRVGGHVTRFTLTRGGVIGVRCSCGKWRGVAPTVAAAERSAATHRAAAR